MTIRPMKNWIIMQHIVTRQNPTIRLPEENEGTDTWSLHPKKADLIQLDMRGGLGRANVGRILAINPKTQADLKVGDIVLYKQHSNHEGMCERDGARLGSYFGLKHAWVIPLHAIVCGLDKIPDPGQVR